VPGQCWGWPFMMMPVQVPESEGLLRREVPRDSRPWGSGWSKRFGPTWSVWASPVGWPSFDPSLRGRPLLPASPPRPDGRRGRSSCRVRCARLDRFWYAQRTLRF
jgi:hypothetical protein